MYHYQELSTFSSESGKFPFDSNPSLVTNEVSYLQQNKTPAEDKYTISYGKENTCAGVCTAKTKVESPFLVSSRFSAFGCLSLQTYKVKFEQIGECQHLSRKVPIGTVLKGLNLVNLDYVETPTCTFISLLLWMFHIQGTLSVGYKEHTVLQHPVPGRCSACGRV